MDLIVIGAEKLNLPASIAKKLKGRKLELIETKEGVLIKPIDDPINELRGYLEGSKFNTEKYSNQKIFEKGLEL